jgi:pyruvate ferredoxin oxidoreductase gamma subunit
MLRIRFHGRGGQGVKTASRIVGTAGFRQGYFAQDSPLYGAERRGAPVVAFTRLDSRPILERGFVSSPDLLAIADESLLADAQVRALEGVTSRTIVLINSPAQLDLTEIALRFTGSASSLSVALGAAAAKLAGIEKKFVEQAVREELRSVGVATTRLDGNMKLAAEVFDFARPCEAVQILPPSSFIEASPSRARASRPLPSGEGLVTPKYSGPWLGTASVSSAFNTALRKTGDWRVMRPFIDLERCTRCWICFENCPDGAIALKEHDIPQIDYGVCKGCLICAEECPIHAIKGIRETECRI